MALRPPAAATQYYCRFGESFLRISASCIRSYLACVNEIEMLSAIRTQLQERDDALASSLELLEREREIIRRELGYVQELVALEEQRVATEVRPVPIALAEPDLEPVPDAEPELEPMTQAEPDLVPAPEVELQLEPMAQAEPELVPMPDAELELVPIAQAEPDLVPSQARYAEMLRRIEVLRHLQAS